MSELDDLQIKLVEDDCCPRCYGNLILQRGIGDDYGERYFYVCQSCAANLVIHRKIDGSKVIL